MAMYHFQIDSKDDLTIVSITSILSITISYPKIQQSPTAMKKSFLFLTTILAVFLLSNCDVKTDTHKSDDADEIANNDDKTSIDHLDAEIHNKVITVHHKTDKKEARQLESIFRSLLGEIPDYEDFLSVKTVKNRIEELVGKNNYQFLTDTCDIPRNVEFRNHYFVANFDVHHLENEQRAWILYNHKTDNIVVIIWKYPNTTIFWNKEDDDISEIYNILEVIELDEKENKDFEEKDTQEETSPKTAQNDSEYDIKDIQYKLVPHKTNNNEAKEMDRLFKASLGKYFFDTNIFENSLVKNRIIELAGTTNYKFIVDTCHVTEPFEYSDFYFKHAANVPHQANEKRDWLYYSPEDDNMIIVIWRYPETRVFYNKDERKASFFKEILSEIEEAEKKIDEHY